MKSRPDYDAGDHFVAGEIAGYEPARSDMEFALGAGADKVAVKVLLAMLRYPQRGTVRVTAQAFVRHASDS